MSNSAKRKSVAMKYKIDECLLKYNVLDHKEIMKILPGLLGISRNTFHNYRKLTSGSKQDIPHEKVVMFECLFGLKSGELLNDQIFLEPLTEILKR
jgi:hypothetical protein